MIGTFDTSWLQFPNLSASPITIIAWIVGFPSLVIALLCLEGKISGLTALLVLVFISVFVLGALGITILSMGGSLSVVPLPITQIMGSVVILRKHLCVPEEN
ncbi:MAG: hypothetical protein ACXABY_27925 [Candidatus Thorarchaeota archaeon]|jgi:hypothetical protein